MRIETHTPARSTASVFVWSTFARMDQSRMSYDYPPQLADGKGSLATSPAAASLQKAIMELARELFLERMTAIPNAPLSASLFPLHVDVACFEPAAEQQSLAEDREREQLAARLWAAFDADPLEDGMGHPAEEIIREALGYREDQHVFEWLRILSLDATRPSFAASVLRCLGRQAHPGMGSWRAGLVCDGLAMDDVEIRDAAVQAAELWGGPDMQKILQAHSEPEPWLRDYIRDVIDDLGE